MEFPDVHFLWSGCSTVEGGIHVQLLLVHGDLRATRHRTARDAAVSVDPDCDRWSGNDGRAVSLNEFVHR